SDSPRPSENSCWRSSSSPCHGASPGAAEVSCQASSRISTSGSAASLAEPASIPPSESPSWGRSMSLGPAPRDSKVPVESLSSSASSITLVSSSSRIWAWSSRAGNCSSLIACCSCGVIVSCWPRRSCREAFSIASHTEVLAQVHLADALVRKDLVRSSGGDHGAAVDDHCTVADAKGFAHVVVGDQHADAALGELAHDLLDVHHGNRVDAREGLVEQDETRCSSQR